MSHGLLLIRLVFGLSLAAHGSQKLFGWFGGGGPHTTAGSFEKVWRVHSSAMSGAFMSGFHAKRPKAYQLAWFM